VKILGRLLLTVLRVDAYLCYYCYCNLYNFFLYFSDYGVVSVHHVGILCENLERSLDFYQNVLGMPLAL